MSKWRSDAQETIFFFLMIADLFKFFFSWKLEKFSKYFCYLAARVFVLTNLQIFLCINLIMILNDVIPKFVDVSFNGAALSVH